MWAVLSPFPSKREGDGSLFCALTRRKFFLRLIMISWGQFYVTERFCDFLKRHNLLVKLQPWLTFLWTTFCRCFSNILIYWIIFGIGSLFTSFNNCYLYIYNFFQLLLYQYHKNNQFDNKKFVLFCGTHYSFRRLYCLSIGYLV